MGEGTYPFHGIGRVRQRRIAAVVFVIPAADGEAEAVSHGHDNAGGPDLDVELDRLT